MIYRTKKVEEYSFEQFVRQSGCCKDAHVFDGCMISQETIQPDYRSPLLRIDAYVMLICIGGKLQLKQNTQTHLVCRNSLFIYSPNDIIQIECKEICSAIYVVVTPDYLCNHYCYWKQILPLMIHIRNKSLITTSTEETKEYIRMADCILSCMQRAQQSEWSREAALSSMKMLFYTLFLQIKASTAYNEKATGIAYTNRNEEYFAHFMKLLSAHYKQERKVDFYASKLYMTPKHLSSVVKEVSGNSPAKWIDKVVVEEIQYLLKYSNTSIKEIAYQLNFPNMSFLGKFFKRYTGLSPYHYRTRTCNII